ncbi:DUF3592 domain-containing protein [Bradyrhizobium manausense]|uniref:DUF3592 domain-containing protein n=1 Tax=Bradyrhizobium TaxID=374 RepID=UPI001BAC3E03|nr:MULTISPECIES: DUF3592 domain-containing protein [Bradyrhizobium]MBR0826297.1 DUF3592 domain-containing protein [Bradyrhizobium manausense]UVO31696.1 DUF3592 domain-containing protein [Bradyrhizobium arachidis]
MDSTQLLWTQIGAGVCTLLFGGMLFNLLRLRNRLAAAASWTRVEGVVIASQVSAPPSHASDDLNDATPVVRYRYSMCNQEFEGDKTRIGGEPMTTRTLATRLAARYPVGAAVEVHVDPNDPSNAVLDPSQVGNLAAQAMLTLTFGVIAAVLIAHTVAGRVLYVGQGVPLFAFLLPVVAFAASIAAFLSFVRMRRLARASRSWPTVPGRITSSSVIEELIEDRRDDDKTSINRKKIHRYQLDLRYAYRVGKRDYVGINPNWGWTGVYGLRELADKAAAHFPLGGAVTIYYDPDHPANAVLEPGGRQGSFAPLVFGAISAAVGAVLLVFFLRAGFS